MVLTRRSRCLASRVTGFNLSRRLAQTVLCPSEQDEAPLSDKETKQSFILMFFSNYPEDFILMILGDIDDDEHESAGIYLL